MSHNLRCLLCFVLIWLPVHAMADPMVFTYRSPESARDARYDYDNAILKLALEKTKPDWGDYTLVPSPIMNLARAVDFMHQGLLINPMFKCSANNQLCEELSYAPFPVDLGIVGYRLFFTSIQLDQRLSQVRSLDELRHFSIGQGKGWLDVRILRSAGFTVTTIPRYESLFPMVAEGRFYLLSRGINEVREEARNHKNIKNLVLNKTVGLYYPLPRFFFTNAKSTQAAKRVYQGLVRAYEDGSMLELWERMYRPSIDFSTMNNIRFFHIDNPLIDRIPAVYKPYMVYQR